MIKFTRYYSLSHSLYYDQIQRDSHLSQFRARGNKIQRNTKQKKRSTTETVCLPFFHFLLYSFILLFVDGTKKKKKRTTMEWCMQTQTKLYGNKSKMYHMFPSVVSQSVSLFLRWMSGVNLNWVKNEWN